MCVCVCVFSGQGDEDEGEEAGTFSLASQDVLKGRAMKKASAGTQELRYLFSARSAPRGASLFSGFGNGGGFKSLGGLTNGTSSTSALGASRVPPTSSAAPGKHTWPLVFWLQSAHLSSSSHNWITKHVDDNPLCDLNPIFKDYERHLASIEKQYGAAQAEGGAEEKQQDAAAAPAAPSSSSLFSFSKTEEKSSSSSSLPTGVSFNFGKKVDKLRLGSLGSAPSFSFSPSSSSSSGPPLFGGSTAPLSFSGTKTDDASAAVQVKEVKEDDAFYSQKMFYKKEAEFKEKGVGTLHLKETAEGKTQMIIRADTNLGNILLNILVPPSMPCSRVGKNNVMVVCVPNPPLDDKSPSSPVPLLIRVKTAEDADELHKILEEKKS
uniref:Nuclear pore complex protein Nup50 n=1 Tax=Salarias fasciatus TaxID=181472 RepID=A0A672FHH1_SALFA